MHKNGASKLNQNHSLNQNAVKSSLYRSSANVRGLRQGPTRFKVATVASRWRRVGEIDRFGI